MSQRESPPRQGRRRNSGEPEIIVLEDMEDDAADPSYRPGASKPVGKLSIMSPIMKKDKQQLQQQQQDASRSQKFVSSNASSSSGSVVSDRQRTFKTQRLGGKHLNVVNKEDVTKAAAKVDVDEDDDMEETEYEDAVGDDGDEEQELNEADEEVKAGAIKDEDDSEIEDTKGLSEFVKILRFRIPRMRIIN